MSESENDSSYSSSDKEYIYDKDTQEYRKVDSKESSPYESDEDSSSSEEIQHQIKGAEIQHQIKAAEIQHHAKVEEIVEEKKVEYKNVVVEEPLQYFEANIKNVPFGLYKLSSRNPGELINIEQPSIILAKNEVDGFNFKVNKNKEKIEDFLSIIETLGEQIGQKKLGKDENIRNLIEKLKNSENIEVSEKISKLLNVFYCDNCGQPKEEIHLTCGHSFCSNCLKVTIQRETKGFIILTEEEKQKGEPTCPSCNSPYTLEDYQNLLKEKFEKIKEFLDTREKEQNGRKVHYDHQRDIHRAMNLETREKRENDPNRLTQCKRCLKAKELPHFFNNPCDCTCKECFSILILGGMRNCCYCGNWYNGAPCQILENCDGCKSPVYIVGNQLTLICNSHSHCLECLKKVSETKKCQKCKKNIKSSQMAEIRDALNFRCYSCKQLLAREYIKSKACCQKQTCIYCQSQNFACLACNQIIEQED